MRRTTPFVKWPDGTEEEDLGIAEAPLHFSTIDSTNSDLEKQQLEQDCERAFEKLINVLAPEHLAAVEEIWQQMDDNGMRFAPRFDTGLVRRYALSRVFDLGWTTCRFGEFDRAVNRIGYGRESAKPERIGKKYQWIAYHEILAFIADHYQFLEKYNEDEGAHSYEGPWQIHLRDIDPSCTLSTFPGGTSREEYTPSWWCPLVYEDWGDDVCHWDWIANKDNIPDIENLLSATNPSDGTQWLNVDGLFNWRQSHAPDIEPYDVERREFWLRTTGYFFHVEDFESFARWAESMDFWGNWMPGMDDPHEIFMGECFGSTPYQYFSKSENRIKGWTRPGKDCPVEVLPATLHYSSTISGYDCSVEEPFALRLPARGFVDCLGLKWTGRGADFVDIKANLVAFDPAAHVEGPTSILIREDAFGHYLSVAGLAFFWTMQGGKRMIGGSNNFDDYMGAMRISGAYWYYENQLQGSWKTYLDRPEGEGAQ